jgi:uncharacterized protein (DUF2147 family)
MRKLLFLLISVISTSVLAQTDPTGRWKTIDEETGEPKSIIEIYREGNAFSGKVAKILTGNTSARCTECEGKQKNAPILGLQIIDGLKADDEPMTWDGGSIFDPQKGASYRLSAWYEEGNTDVLYIRGKHWTGLYRTQRWFRE